VPLPSWHSSDLPEDLQSKTEATQSCKTISHHPRAVGELGTIFMINFRILNMTIPATTTCNSNILDVLNSKMKGNK
jgi:hypothetical protein